MNPSDLQDLKRLIIHVAEYYGRELKPIVLTMMAEDLQDLPLSEVRRGYDEYRRNAKNDRFPLPAVIRELVAPDRKPASHKALATEAAARIIAATTKYGYPDPRGAEAYIGDLGWRIVELQGGWTRHCESDGPTGVIQAQYIRLGEALLERAASGDVGPPALPPAVGGKALPSAAEPEAAPQGPVAIGSLSDAVLARMKTMR